MLKIHIILGSTRQSRTSETVGKWMLSQAKKKPGLKLELVDLRDWKLPFFDEATPPSMMKGKKYDNKLVQKWAKKISEADAYIIIAPEYNHGYPAVLKNAMDYVYYEWHKKAVGFVGYGSVEGARSIEQLRLVSIELHMAPIRQSVHIRDVWTAFDEKGQPKDPGINATADIFLDQLTWWATALKNAR